MLGKCWCANSSARPACGVDVCGRRVLSQSGSVSWDAEHRVGEMLGVPGCEFFVAYHAAQVKRAANEVLGEFEVEVRPDFTALDSPSEHLRAGPASGINDGAGRLLQQVFGST